MNKKAKRAATKFYKMAGKKPTVQNVVSGLKKLGYNVILFNTPQGDELLESLGLDKDKENTNAFTAVGDARFVFLNNSISSSDKLYALLHEAGHIMLGHVGSGMMKWQDSSMMEAEANAFSAEVIAPTSPISMIAAIVTVIAMIVSFCFGYGVHRPETVTVFSEQTAANSIASTNSIVYITSSGSKYHSSNCIYTKDKNCAMIDKRQAQLIFEPCSVCNP